jgi:phage baseplate assembly protein V
MTQREDRHAIRLMVRRGEIVKVYSDQGQQLVDVLGLDGEFFRGVYRAQFFGDISNPPAGSDGILLFMAGFPNQAVFIAGAAPTLSVNNLPIGTKLLHNAFGDAIALFEGDIQISTIAVHLSANLVELDLGGSGVMNLIGGRLQVNGDVKSSGKHVNFANLPTVDPHVAGDLWNSGGTVKISAG